MTTLYDLLGALPDDDAEEIRAAFRKAVKSAHPDINPGDPDAAVKFRQIVRANEILVDQEQRAVYDHLLDLARIEKEAASKQAFAAAIYKVASGTMVLAGLSVVAIGGYLLFMQVSAAPIETSIAPSVASWTEAVRKTSHSVARILARPSFAIAHTPPSDKSQDRVSGDATDVADASSAAVDLRDRLGDGRNANSRLAPGSASARDSAWDDRNDGSSGAIAYLTPKYPAVHIESTVAPFGFGQNGTVQNSNAPNSAAQNSTVQNGSAQNANARNSNAQNSIPANGAVPVGAKHAERAGNPVSAARPFRMPPPHTEAPMTMMPEPRPPRLTSAQDLSRQESPGSSSSIMR
jgi:curved DNA-binding protein CbpA